MKKEDTITAYVDVLGGKNLICQNDQVFLSKCQDIFVETDKQLRKTVDFPKIKIRRFSDNLCAILPLRNCKTLFDAVQAMAMYVSFMQIYALWKHALLLRGAIGLGGMSFTPELISGMALVECVENEENKAIFPRIIILDNIIQQITQHDLLQLVNEHLFSSDGELYFIDYFAYYLLNMAAHQDKTFSFAIWLDIAKKIVINLNNSKNSPQIQDKWLWVAKHFSLTKNNDSQFDMTVNWDSQSQSAELRNNVNQKIFQ